MAQKNRKIHKKRGSRTSGHGHHNKNRGAGNRGGVGLAGGHKGKWTWMVKNLPNHFGRHGFTVPSDVKNVYGSINVGIIDEFLLTLVSEGLAVEKNSVFEIDLSKTDFSKVLGNGRVTHAMKIKAEMFSSRAIEKIEEAGGKAIPLTTDSE